MGIANFTLKPSKRDRRGFSLIELLIVLAIIAIIAMIAIPKIGKNLIAARETTAIGNMRTITQVQLQYSTQFNKFAPSLTELGPPASGADGPAAAGLLPKNLAEGKVGGYIFTVQATPGGYSATAVPEQFGTTGTRNFYSDQNGAIHYSSTLDPASDKSPVIGQ